MPEQAIYIRASKPRLAQPTQGGVQARRNAIGGITARLVSRDTGLTVFFGRTTLFRAPSKCDRRFSSRWNPAGVAQASPQFLEYQETEGEVRTYHVMMDGYALPGGVANNIEPDIANLKLLTQRVEGKPYAHRCLWIQGGQPIFRCVVEDVSIPIELVSSNGAALTTAPNFATITLRELPR